MPSVKITSTAGPAKIAYSISTPSKVEAKEIDKKLPCLVLLHPVFCASEIWHPQVADTLIRQFNVIAMDARMHGRTTGLVKESFNFNDAAEDVFQVLKALKVPPCVVAGISMGATIAIRMAALHPEHVKGLFLISLLPPEEPPEVAFGRREVWETFAEGIKTDDEELMQLGASGAAQLAFGDSQDPFINRIMPPTLRLLAANCKNDPAVLRGRHLITVELFINRGGLTKSELERIDPKACPVKMIWGSKDVAYDLKAMLGKKKDLDEGGLDVELITIKGGPHFCNVTHAKEINPLLASFVRSRFPKSSKDRVPTIKNEGKTPFEAFLDPEVKAEEESSEEEGTWA